MVRKLTWTLAALAALSACAGTGGDGERKPPSTSAEARVAFQGEASTLAQACLTNLAGQSVNGAPIEARGYTSRSLFGVTNYMLELRSMGFDLQPERISLTVGNPQNCMINATGPFGRGIVDDFAAALVARGYAEQPGPDRVTRSFSGPIGIVDLGAAQVRGSTVGVNMIVTRRP